MRLSGTRLLKVSLGTSMYSKNVGALGMERHAQALIHYIATSRAAMNVSWEIATDKSFENKKPK